MNRLRQTIRRTLLLMAIALCAITLLGAGDGSTDARFNKLGHNLMCMCGCNQVLLECNHVGCSFSDRMREELAAGMQRGDSDSLILQSFVQKYGNTVLSAPTTTGFNRVAWIMPFAIFLASMGAVIVVIRTWKLRPAYRAANAAAGLPPEQLDELRERARKETEL
ncbi:MAG TPA: cytochrome c-type biogenesis protein CcmH [Clostridia bacterium]|nr:cytochrome c-type biogenesis protein CcmH [Clostridia bacterium]